VACSLLVVGDDYVLTSAHSHSTHPLITDGGAAGYLSAAYTESLAEFGSPLVLPRSGSWLLRRTIVPGISDAMGPYPLFCCQDWRAIGADLDELAAANPNDDVAAGAPVSAVVVTDPFADCDPALLAAAFRDRAVAFKEHFVADLSRPLSSFVSAHHRRYARRDLAVEECADPLRWLDDWCTLYQNLCARHEIRGLPALSRAAFRCQLAVPGLLALRASAGAETLGMVLWYRQGDVAYYHLAAYSDEGYRQRASFPLFWLAFERLAAAGVRWAGLGAGPSSSSPSPSSSGAAASQGTDGLVRFKRGWSTGTRTTYLCGRIFRPDTYRALARERGFEESRYFPAYRHGELA